MNPVSLDTLASLMTWHQMLPRAKGSPTHVSDTLLQVQTQPQSEIFHCPCLAGIQINSCNKFICMEIKRTCYGAICPCEKGLVKAGISRPIISLTLGPGYRNWNLATGLGNGCLHQCLSTQVFCFITIPIKCKPFPFQSQYCFY